MRHTLVVNAGFSDRSAVRLPWKCSLCLKTFSRRSKERGCPGYAERRVVVRFHRGDDHGLVQEVVGRTTVCPGILITRTIGGYTWQSCRVTHASTGFDAIGVPLPYSHARFVAGVLAGTGLDFTTDDLSALMKPNRPVWFDKWLASFKEGKRAKGN